MAQKEFLRPCPVTAPLLCDLYLLGCVTDGTSDPDSQLLPGQELGLWKQSYANACTIVLIIRSEELFFC